MPEEGPPPHLDPAEYMARNTIAVGGSLAQKPGFGGHAWVLLQYLLGFRRLGWDVLFIDRLEPEMCRDSHGSPCELGDSVNVRYLSAVMERFGLGANYALLHDGGSGVIGRSRVRLLEELRGCALLLNVMGFTTDEDVLAACPRRVFLDVDPGFGQIWRELELHDCFCGHDDFVTIGQNIGLEGCPLPSCGLDWIATSPPVVLSEWPALPLPPDAPLTSVGSWRGVYGPLEHAGRTYGHRVHEFRRFLALPRMTDQHFELALNIEPAETGDLSRLAEHGWELVDPLAVAATPADYRTYIQASMGELMIAKSMYVQAQSGWFSDRSVCYLASGRPVVAQDTGLSGLYPTGRGLLTFATLEEAAGAVAEVRGNPAMHSRAARALAEEHFDSDRVLGRLLTQLGIG